MPKWSDFGNIWTTLRELDVNAIREEAERPLAVAAVGHETALDELDRLLHSGPNRYPPGPNPLELIPLAQAASRAAGIERASILVLAVDARHALTPTEVEAFGRLEALALPFLVVLIYAERLPAGDATLPPAVNARMIALPDPNALDAADRLASAFLSRAPRRAASDGRAAAARPARHLRPRADRQRLVHQRHLCARLGPARADPDHQRALRRRRYADPDQEPGAAGL